MPPAFSPFKLAYYWSCVDSRDFLTFSVSLRKFITFLTTNPIFFLNLHLFLHTRSTMSPLDEGEVGHEGKRIPNFPLHGSFKRSSVHPVIGLRILTQLSHGESNLVLKSACRLRIPTPSPPPTDTSPESCFLKSCHLCNKVLAPDKDIYMSGDEGFCSVECRNRQMVMDEKKEIEASTKKMLASFQHCRSAGGCETCAILEDLRRRRKPISRHKNQALVS